MPQRLQLPPNEGGSPTHNRVRSRFKNWFPQASLALAKQGQKLAQQGVYLIWHKIVNPATQLGDVDYPID